MYAKVEPSGCEEWHGLVKVRFDLFLEEDDARYDDCYVSVPIIPESGYPGEVDKEGNPKDWKKFKDWLDSLPHIWQLAPFHSHFLRFEPNVSQDTVLAAINHHIPNFYAAWLQEWDKVPGGMRHGWDVETRRPRPRRYDLEMSSLEYQTRKLACLDKVDLIKASGFSVRSTDIGEAFPSTDIDIGPGDGTRASLASSGNTMIDLANPANDTGAIDTFEAWAVIVAMANTKIGTFHGSSTTYTNRDYETVGTVAVGGQEFTGLDCNVTSGDFIGTYYTAGYLEMDMSGGSGYYRKAGDQFGQGEQGSYILQPNYAISLYGTGETPVVAPTVTTQAASPITTNSATGNGNITVTGGENCDKRGIVYGTTSQGDPGDVAPGASGYDDFEEETNSFGTGPFTRTLTGLDSKRTYYARAYAHNSAGYSYGGEVSFTTLLTRLGFVNFQDPGIL